MYVALTSMILFFLFKLFCFFFISALITGVCRIINMNVENKFVEWYTRFTDSFSLFSFVCCLEWMTKQNACEGSFTHHTYIMSINEWNAQKILSLFPSYRKKISF